MKRLSSDFTFFHKLISPWFLIAPGLFAWITCLLNITAPGAIGGLLFTTVWLAIVLSIDYWNNFNLKQVGTDGKQLYVSNFLKEIAIPLSDIIDVKETGGHSWWRWPPRRVVVKLRSSSEFGKTIKFVPAPDTRVVTEMRRVMGWGSEADDYQLTNQRKQRRV